MNKYVKVIFANSKYNYTTRVNKVSIDKDLTNYFVNNTFNLGVNGKDNMQVCKSIEIYTK